VRVNSTLRGPNPLGAYAAIVLILLIAALVRRKLQFTGRKYAIGIGLLTLCSLVALWISYSRSALLAAIVGIGIVLAITITRQLSRKLWIIGSVVAFAIIGGLIANQNSSFVSNVLLHENPNEGNSFNSNDGHLESLVHGSELLLAQPLGAGVGSTGSASLYTDVPRIIENQYLFVAHEAGWLGLLLFVVIFVLIMMRLWCARRDWLSLGVFASGVGLAVIGILQPVWVDDTVSIVWWGLAAIAIASMKGVKDDRKQTK
jgi:O-antigen ligase